MSNFIYLKYRFVDLPYPIGLCSVQIVPVDINHSKVLLHLNQKGAVLSKPPCTVALMSCPGLRICVKLINQKQRVEFYCYLPSALPYLNTSVRKLTSTLIGYLLPFSCVIELRGLGYKLRVRQSRVLNQFVLEFKLGLSHTVIFKLPLQIRAKALGIKSRALKLEGPNLQQLHSLRQQICNLRKPNVYKLKGIFPRIIRPKLKRGYKQLK